MIKGRCEKQQDGPVVFRPFEIFVPGDQRIGVLGGNGESVLAPRQVGLNVQCFLLPECGSGVPGDINEVNGQNDEIG